METNPQKVNLRRNQAKYLSPICLPTNSFTLHTEGRLLCGRAPVWLFLNQGQILAVHLFKPNLHSSFLSSVRCHFHRVIFYDNSYVICINQKYLLKSSLTIWWHVSPGKGTHAASLVIWVPLTEPTWSRGENRLHQVVFWTPHVCHNVCAPTHTRTCLHHNT